MQYNIYEALNLSVDFYTSYHHYESYRKRLSEDISSIIKEMLPDKVAFFGVGNTGDVDYLKLMKYNAVLTLTDIDAKAMERGLRFQGIGLDEVRIKIFNYLGHYQEAIGILEDGLQDLDNRKVYGLDDAMGIIENFFDQVMDQLNELDYSVHFGEKQNMIVLLPIYTQLLFVDLVSRLRKLKHYNELQDMLLQKMVLVIDGFNRNLVQIVENEGCLFVLSDIMELDRKGTKKALSVKEIMSRIRIYENQYGYGLGSYGLLNMSEYAKPIQEFYYQWHFDEARSFLVKGVLYKKTPK